MSGFRRKISKLGWLGVLGVASGLASMLGIVQGCSADYGPMPEPDYGCTTDEECIERFWNEWYCDEVKGECAQNLPDAGS
jgi:hypothetical protein